MGVFHANTCLVFRLLMSHMNVYNNNNDNDNNNLT